MRVRIVYRNYKPVHALYRSLQESPPVGVVYEFPDVKKHIRKLYPIYLRFRDYFIVKWLLRICEYFVFQSKSDLDDDTVELVEYLQLVPVKPPRKPFVIDFEHASALTQFSTDSRAAKDFVQRVIGNSNFGGLIAISKAARQSLCNYFPDQAGYLISKTEVIYPALPHYWRRYRDSSRIDILGARVAGVRRILFVGNDVERKGLPELMIAFGKVRKEFKDIELVVVSDCPNSLKNKYSYPGIRHFNPVYSANDIIRGFYLNCDLLAFPTHLDTFGMAVLDALSCGTPILATRQFAIPELVYEGENAWLVESKRLFLDSGSIPGSEAELTYFKEPEAFLVEQLCLKLREIFSSGQLDKMDRNKVSRDFEDGERFSVSRRNADLLNVYSRAVVSK